MCWPRAKEEKPKRPPCAQTFGPLAQKAPCHAPEPSFSGPVADALGRREIASGPCIPVRADASTGGRQQVTRKTFQFRVDKKKLQEAEWRDGHYLLRSNLTAGDPSVLWTRYVQLTQIESVFRSLKSELSIRPIRHQLEHRADAHILIAFLAYCLQVTLKQRLLLHARVDAHGGAGEVGRNQNDRCLDSHGRSTLVDSAALHAAFSRHEATH